MEQKKNVPGTREQNRTESILLPCPRDNLFAPLSVFFSMGQKFTMSHRPPPSATLAPRLFSCAARHKNILTHSLAAHDTHRGENNMFFFTFVKDE